MSRKTNTKNVFSVYLDETRACSRYPYAGILFKYIKPKATKFEDLVPHHTALGIEPLGKTLVPSFVKHFKCEHFPWHPDSGQEWLESIISMYIGTLGSNRHVVSQHKLASWRLRYVANKRIAKINLSQNATH